MPPGAPETLTAALLRAAQTPRGLTLQPGATRLGYSELLRRAQSVASSLCRRLSELKWTLLKETCLRLVYILIYIFLIKGSEWTSHGVERIGAGYAVLQLPLLEHHFCCFWGCVLSGTKPVAVAIPVDYADAGHAVCGKLCNVWRLLEAPPVITSMANREKLEQLELFQGPFPPQILVFEEWLDLKKRSGMAQAQGRHALHLDSEALRRRLLPVTRHAKKKRSHGKRLSSGSTGVPKCIQITHGGAIACYRDIRRYYTY